MTIKRGTGELDPGAARTPAEFVALLRRLKERSGLTYRQLEQKAAERGDVLARSTVADVLRREALPRAELVTALVRACGAEGDASLWLAARERLASASDSEREGAASVGPAGSDGSEGPDGFEGAEGSAGPAGSTGPAEATGAAHAAESMTSAGSPDARKPSGRHTDDAGSRTRTASLAAVASLSTVALLVIGALVLFPEDGNPPATGDTGDRGPTVTAGRSGASEAAGAWQTPEAATSPDAGPARPGPAPGLSRIRPVRASGLCLTDGQVRAESGESKVVAVQRPCGEAVPPETHLLKADDGTYRIQWDHPVEDTGCLTVLDDGAFRNMLEPWNNCAAPGRSQLFRIERAEGGDGWRLRPEQRDGMCVGIRGDADELGAVAVVEPCANTRASSAVSSRQVFLIGPG
ncbi:helix-turn-helix domain-containing protein [Streptomyces sp. TRM S81-3]|uniref:Helix-turn-helix domain-containing protein n=1 Tax=Streptomyces griseicoloratus TaxID=2752516 RepID=A0A926LAM8_9ACTN|nr:helix-turn-helix domain-containing protein [Streptomyces griseicoloratus]MBD0425150.1 helix-turn-helix domain-containing protein [Streptomyces griseicoloratus]